MYLTSKTSINLLVLEYFGKTFEILRTNRIYDVLPTGLEAGWEAETEAHG